MGERVSEKRQSGTSLPTFGSSSPCARPSQALILLAVLLVLLGAAPLPAAVASENPKGGLTPLGSLDASSIFTFMDPVNRRAYAGWQTGVKEFDLSTPGVPVLTRTGSFGATTSAAEPNRVAVDSAHKRAFAVGSGTLMVIDLETLALVPGKQWTFTTMGLAGFGVAGITYSPSDGRIYAVGVLGGSSGANIYRRPVAASAVVAIEVVNSSGQFTPDSPSSLVWVKELIPQCQNPMDNWRFGASVFLNRDSTKLYVPCVKRAGHPGQSGLLRLWIRPGGVKAGWVDVPQFRSELFPISGVYTATDVFGDLMTGMAAFDYETERFFMQSQSYATPGVWVFDGMRSSWVGFVQGPGSGLGIDHSTGHLFAVGGDGMIQVADGRATPITQGEKFPPGSEEYYGGVGYFYFADPVSHRVFVPVADRRENSSVIKRLSVLRDDTPQAESLAPVDYDSQTQDVAEGKYTNSRFDGKATGFGVRGLIVGGYGGVVASGGVRYTLNGQVLYLISRPIQDETIPNHLPSDRDLHGAAVGSLDVSANIFGDEKPFVSRILGRAQALAPSDNGTEREWMQDTGKQWPWPQALCDVDTPQNSSSGSAGSASATCSLDPAETATHSSFGGVVAGGGSFSVASASFSAKTRPHPVLGVVTEAESRAAGISINSPSGSAAIDRLSVTAITSAHGSPSSARATWERAISGVVIRDADGKDVQSFSGCKTRVTGTAAPVEEGPCREIARAISQTLALKGEIRLPVPAVAATPRGAFAEVRKSDPEHYQGRVINNESAGGDNTTWASPAMEFHFYNDSEEKSRLVVQVAGVEASSKYTVNCLPTRLSGRECTAPPSGSGEAPPPGSADEAESPTVRSVEDFDSPILATSSPRAREPRGLLERVKEIIKEIGRLPGAALAFLIRQPKEALLLAGMWMLLGAAPAAIWRRRLLARTLA